MAASCQRCACFFADIHAAVDVNNIDGLNMLAMQTLYLHTNGARVHNDVAELSEHTGEAMELGNPIFRLRMCVVWAVHLSAMACILLHSTRAQCH